MNSDHSLLTLERLDALLDEFPNRRVGLIGDLFLDRYLMIEPGVREMSIETGMETYQITSVRNDPGALGTVINNLVALGVGRILPLAVIGEDGHGDDLVRELQQLSPVDQAGIVRCSSRLTPTYTKPMQLEDGGGWRELNRLDIRDRKPLSPAAQQDLIHRLDVHFDDVDGWIVLDQIVESNWGVVNDSIRGRLRDLSQAQPDRLLYVDSRRHLAEFDFGFVKCNRDELLQAVDQSPQDASLDSLAVAANQFASRTGHAAFCTLGEAGMLAAQPNGQWDMVKGFPADGPIDIVGAGDAATSAIVPTLLSGGTLIEACQLGNLAASVTVQKLGETGSASPAELRERYRQVQTKGA